MTKPNKTHPLNQCVFYKIESKALLEKRLLIPEGGMKAIIDGIEYKTFDEPKRGGGTRRITAPRWEIKRVQKRVLRLLSGIEKPEWVISGTKGKCHIDNAKFHRQNPYVITMDLKAFYDNCTRDHVYRFFRNVLLMSPDCAKCLTDICTWENGIPTGTPTSQLLAYFAYRGMFHELNDVALHCGGLFSLYVDDMTISSPNGLSPRGLVNAVRMVARKYGHELKQSKTHYYSADSFKLVTGVAISPEKELCVGNSLQERVIDGLELCIENPSEKGKQQTLGRIQAARMIEERKFPEVERIVRLA